MPGELLTFRFRVTLTLSTSQGPAAKPVDASKPQTGPLLADIGFQECSGLDLETDVREYLEGGRNDGVVRRVGRVKLQPLVLKRCMAIRQPQPEQRSQPPETTVRPELWAWLQDTVVGRLPIRRYDGLIEVTGRAEGSPPMASWRFVRGLPLKVTGPALNAKTGEVAIEELHIAHEGLHLVTKVDL